MSALDRLQTLRVKDVMNKSVASVRDSDLMSVAADMLVQNSISAVPVVNADGACVGVLSSSDFVRRERQAHGGEKASREAVARYMTPTVQAIAPDERLLAAAQRMCAGHVHRLFVVDIDGRPVGVISTMDIVAALVNAVDEMNVWS